MCVSSSAGLPGTAISPLCFDRRSHSSPFPYCRLTYPKHLGVRSGSPAVTPTLNPRDRGPLPDRHGVQRVKRVGAMSTEAQLAHPDLVIETPALHAEYDCGQSPGGVLSESSCDRPAARERKCPRGCDLSNLKTGVFLPSWDDLRLLRTSDSTHPSTAGSVWRRPGGGSGSGR